MIRLFVSDIDGCLSQPYQSFELDKFRHLVSCLENVEDARERGCRPAFSLCSGRAYAYVEAMTQLLNLRMPVLFEAGGGMFDPIQAQVLWNPLFSNEIERQLADLKEWLVGTCLRGTSLMFDYGKRTQVGLIGPEKVDVDRTIPVVARYLENKYPDLRMFYTEYAIDVLARDITKRQGLRWLSERTEIPVREMAYIGDSSGDIEALESVGFSFAPANATEGVKSRARVVTEKHLIEGVIEAYLWCERYNKDNKEHPGDSISPG